MNNYNTYHHGSRDMTPIMVMPSGQVIYQSQPAANVDYYSQAQPAPQPVQTLGWKPAALVLLALAIPLVLMSAHAIAF
jgi:hypothetical protein